MLALAGALCAYFVITFLTSRRYFWHDELYTLYIATAPGWSWFWRELQLDLNPPLSYLAVRASTALFGQSGYAVRLPSILAFLAGSLCLWRYVSVRLDRWYGLLAMLVFWASPFFYYATEARPYALVIGFLGATLLCWQHVTEPGRSFLWVVGLGLAVAGMMMSHLMALFYVFPFCVAEAIRLYESRKLDFPVWVALLAPCALPFFWLRLMSRFEASVFPPAFRASLHKVAEAYYGSLKLEALPLLVALGLAWLLAAQARTEKRPRPRIRLTDLGLMLGLVAIPLLVNLALMRSHGAYFDRYGSPLAFGYALAFAFLLASHTARNRATPITASAVLLLFVLGFNLGPGLKQSVWARRGEPSTEQSMEQIEPKLPLVAASGLTFLEMDHYANQQTVDRLYYLTDRELALHYANATIFEGMPGLKAYFPIRAKIVPYHEFVAAHPDFLVLGTPDYPEDWLLRALLDEHADVRYLGDFPGPYKDSQLYRVTAEPPEK